MSFDDFCIWFNVLFVGRRADDRWTRMTVRSCWMDRSAGGCCPNNSSWRNNPQWILKIRRPTRLVMSLTLPPPESTTDEAADKAICIQILRGNAGSDSRRRRLTVNDDAEVVVSSEPRFSRRIVSECTLEASDAPYILMPCTYEPGQESSFTLVIRSDDADDDGKPDFSFEPVRPRDDWVQTELKGSWSELNGGGGSPGTAGFAQNPQLHLRVKARGRFFLFVDHEGVEKDLRAESGMQAAVSFPQIGVAVALGDGSDRLPVSAIMPQHAPAVARDGVVFECVLEAAEVPYVVIPYLQDPTTSLGQHPNLSFRLCVYSDAPFELGGSGDHELCRPDCDYDCKDCPMFAVYERLHTIERGLDRHLKYLSALQF